MTTPPELAKLGEINKDTTITGEQAAGLAGVFDAKITELSRKPQLTPGEAALIDQTAKSGALMIIKCEDYLGLRGSQDPAKAKALVDTAYMLAQGMTDDREERKTLINQEPMSLLDRVANAPSVADQPGLRMGVEEFGKAGMSYFADIVAQSGGLQDAYVADNLRAMVETYDRAEQAPVAA